MTAADLAGELVRQQGLRLVADMQATAWQDLAEALADNLAAVLICLTDCGVVLEGGKSGPNGDEDYWWVRWPAMVTGDESAALADAIRGARVVLDELHETLEGSL